MLICFCYRVTRQTFGIKIALADRDKRADTVADATRPHDPTQEDFPAAGTRGGLPPAPQGPARPRRAADAPAGCQGCNVGTWQHRAAAAGPGVGRGAGRGTGADSAPAGLCQDLTVPAYPSLPGCGFVERLTDALVQSRFVK